MRRLIKAVVEKRPDLEVVFEAANGQEAVENISSADPDIIIMDVEMPVMDGIDATRAIRRINRSVPILMFSSLTSNGAEATLDALAAGANDIVVKPTASGHVTQAMAKLSEDLIPKITRLTKRRHSNPPRAKASQAKAETKNPSLPEPVLTACSLELVVVGVSTGGPDALATLLKGIPKTFPVPILIAQHMPPVFTKLLCQRLTALSGLPVREAADGDVIVPGEVLLAPGDYHLTVSREGNDLVARLNQDPHENSCRPSVNPLFRSAATASGCKALGVILTGMGKDGMEGAGLLKQNDSVVIAQDEESSVVWGMPGKVVEAGFADTVLPLDSIAVELNRLASAAKPAAVPL